MPENAQAARGRRVVMTEGDRTGVRERLSSGGGTATPAASRAAALRRGLPAARSASPVRSGPGPRRNERELASARTTIGHEHQGDDTKPRLDPARLRSRHLRASGRRPLPEPPSGIVDVSRNLSRAPTASLRDRLRRHLTEPVRRALTCWLWDHHFAKLILPLHSHQTSPVENLVIILWKTRCTQPVCKNSPAVIYFLDVPDLRKH